jgi:hypothetical protein
MWDHSANRFGIRAYAYADSLGWFP